MKKEGAISWASIDSFDGNFPQEHHGKPNLVLQHIRNGGRFSAFDATDILMQTLNGLEASGKIVEMKSGYPWHIYRTADPPAAPPREAES